MNVEKIFFIHNDEDLYGILVLIRSIIITNVLGNTFGEDGGNAEITSGIFNTGINELVISINLLSAIMFFVPFLLLRKSEKINRTCSTNAAGYFNKRYSQVEGINS